MHGFSRQFHIVWENAAKPTLWVRPRCINMYTFFRVMLLIFRHIPTRFSVLHQMGKCSKFHPRVRFWNNCTRTFPKLWKLLFYQFPITWMIHAFCHKFPAFCVNPAKWSYIYIFFFHLGFLSWTFTNCKTSGEGGGHFINS